MNFNPLFNRQREKRYGSGRNKVPCQNNSSSNVVPPFGLVRMAGTNSQGVPLVDRPNADGQDVYVNGPVPIPASAFDILSRDWPLFAAYDTASGTPAIGDTWGAANGSYLLTKGKNGFAIQQNPAAGRVLIAPASAPPLAGYAVLSSTTSQIINLRGGGSIAVYPATLHQIDPNTGSDAAANIWFYATTGSYAPVLNTWYPANLYGYDTNNLSVWADLVPYIPQQTSAVVTTTYNLVGLGAQDTGITMTLPQGGWNTGLLLATVAGSLNVSSLASQGTLLADWRDNFGIALGPSGVIVNATVINGCAGTGIVMASIFPTLLHGSNVVHLWASVLAANGFVSAKIEQFVASDNTATMQFFSTS